MNPVVRTLGRVGWCLVLLVLGAGCTGGPAKVDVTGKVTMNGQPLKVGPQGVVRVIFFPYPDVKEGKPYTSTSATVNKDAGTFAVKGIAVGQYLITVEQIDPMPVTDVLKGAFNRKNSPIVRDVASADQVIDIDLAKEATGK